ncbi:TorA-specific chaperone [Breoghania corrubedonensis]|uniref:TorA-specific chaperone n=1 Tax=Breoghania corrubedonensis TaxID=665038 RepID=A0A2T5VBG8_9HYPH|nr:molecular chaperone TorD family protein [Breoghania corrubedonensis]PTW61091.1 TorA-specific chaperone [Breoghania corrubedonensis]
MNHTDTIPGPLYAEALATLSGIFGAPLDKGDVENFYLPLDQGPLAALAVISQLNGTAEGLRERVRSFGETTKAEVELNKAFCLLFLGAGGPKSAPPYESAYVGNGRLFQEPAGIMAKLLRQQGLAPSADFPEAPDHLVLELSLLQETLRLAGLTEEQADIDVIHNLHARLNGWVPDFAAACAAFDRTGFYADAARLLESLLNLPLPCPEPAAA